MHIPGEASRIIMSGRRWWQFELLGFLLNDCMRAIDAAPPQRLPAPPRRHVREWGDLQEVFDRVGAQLHEMTICVERFTDAVHSSTCLGTETQGPDIDAILALAKAGGDAYSASLICVLDCVRTPWTANTMAFGAQCAPHLDAAFAQLNADLKRSASTVRDFLRGIGRAIWLQTAQARILGDAQFELSIEFVLPYQGGRWVDLLEQAISQANPAARAMPIPAARPARWPAANSMKAAPEPPIPGYLYLLLNPAMPHLVTLERSDIDMDWQLPNRALGADRSRRNHLLICAVHCRDCYAAELEVERRLAPTRWAHNPQFYRVECHRAIDVMMDVQAEQDEPMLRQPVAPALTPAPERVYMASWRVRGSRTSSTSVDSVTALHALTVSLQTRHPTLALLYSLSLNGDIVYAGADLEALTRADQAVTLAQSVGRDPDAREEEERKQA